MNTKRLEIYAPQARNDFIAAISHSAKLLGINANETKPIDILGDGFKITGSTKIYSIKLRPAYEALKQAVKSTGYKEVIEEVAYIWFNRLIAIRYMEVNNYFIHGKRVLSNINSDERRPQILLDAHLLINQLPGLEKDKVLKLIQGSHYDELYSQLLLAHCQQLHQWMPQIFSPINDYVGLLLPDNLLATDSLIAKLLLAVDEENFKHVEVIGWLYQYYISDKKAASMDRVGNVKGGYNKNEIPSVTQLFTPNWIVKYMLHNSLGSMWLASAPYSQLKTQMEYYIEPAKQNPEVEAQIKANTPGYIDPKTITVLDPACGSGHILVEAYTILKQIYLEEGYQPNQIPELILKHNLYGLEIDKRATQLATFAVYMQGRADDSQLFNKHITTNIVQIKATNAIDSEHLYQNLSKLSNSITLDEVKKFLEIFHDADMFGSLIQISPQVLEIADKLESIIYPHLKRNNISQGELFLDPDIEKVVYLTKQTRLLAKQYDCVVANPPYMGNKGYNAILKKYVEKNYSKAKADLFSAFIIRSLIFSKSNAKLGFVSPFVWMFISSFEELRIKILSQSSITTLVQLEYNAFAPACIPVCTFVLEKQKCDYKGGFIKLSDFTGADNQPIKTLEAIKNRKCGWFYETNQAKFDKLPCSPIAYWVSDKVADIFATYPPLIELTETRQGMATSDNSRFWRLWFEVKNDDIKFNSLNNEDSILSGRKWFPYNKGGEFRKWYGNQYYVVNWQNDGRELKEFQSKLDQGWTMRLKSREFYFRSGLSWSFISSSYFGVRYFPEGFIFDVSGSMSFPYLKSNELFILGLLCSDLSNVFLNMLNPTINLQRSNIDSIPTKLIPNCELIVKELIAISKADWDSYETSWNFIKHPLLTVNASGNNLANRYATIREYWHEQTARMKELEEENNRLHINAYDLADEFSPDVEDRLVTLTCNPLYRYKSSEDFEARLKLDTYKELISYAIGCAFGRYSLDQDGLIFAGGEFDKEKYQSFAPTLHNILPITDTMHFSDDAVRQVSKFIEVAFGKENHLSNRHELAITLKAGSSDSLAAINNYLSSEFYKDHLKNYQKKPIYWLFSSGKTKAFQALVYLHRMDNSTLATMRTKYIRPLLTYYDSRVQELRAVSVPSKAEIKELREIEKKYDELSEYDRKIEHLINLNIIFDLDDGVTVNYAKFSTVLEKIK